MRTELAWRVESAQCLRSPHSLTKLVGPPIDGYCLVFRETMHKLFGLCIVVWYALGGLVAGFEDSQDVFCIELLVTATRDGRVGNERQHLFGCSYFAQGGRNAQFGDECL